MIDFKHPFFLEMFPVQTKLRREGKCVMCTEIVNMNDFTDDLSKKEFEISGTCQKCQDKFLSNNKE